MQKKQLTKLNIHSLKTLPHKVVLAPAALTSCGNPSPIKSESEVMCQCETHCFVSHYRKPVSELLTGLLKTLSYLHSSEDLSKIFSNIKNQEIVTIDEINYFSTI